MKKLLLLFLILLLSGCAKTQTLGGITQKEITIAGEKVIIGGDSLGAEESKFKPEVKLQKWGDETSIRVWSEEEVEDKATEKDGKIVSKTKDGKKEFNFYAIETKTYSNTNDVRYIKKDLISKEEMAGGYEVFNNLDYGLPVIRSYIPSKGLVFYGYRSVNRELKAGDYPIPVIRYKTEDESDCPVILSGDNNAIVIDYYDPNINSTYFDRLDEAVKQVLANHQITNIYRSGHLYYSATLPIKQIGRIAPNGKHLIVFLYLGESDNSLIENYYNTQSKIRETVVPLGYLERVNASIAEEIVNEFVLRINKKIVLSDYTKEEKQTMDKIDVNGSNWLLTGEREDINRNKITVKNGFQWDIILKERPFDNQVKLKIDLENLIAEYQPELTEQQKEDGHYRPVNVVDSYAFYRKDNPLLKAFHLYRPYITDTNGKGVWGEPKIQDNEITIKIPSGLKYPITIDPTFGYTTCGASSVTSDANQMKGSKFTMNNENGVIDSITAFITRKGNADVKFVLVDAAQAIIENGVSPIGTITEAQTTTTPLTINYITKPTLSANTDYYLMVVFSNNSNGFRYDSSGISLIDTTNSYTTPTDPADGTDGTLKFSIYATYTATAPPSTVGDNATTTIKAGTLNIKAGTLNIK